MRLPLLLAVVLLAAPACAPAARPRAQPGSPSRAADGHVAVVYSPHYRLRLGGADAWRPYDLNRGPRIAQALVRDGVLAPADFLVPDPIARDDLLRIHTPEYLDQRLQTPALLADYLESPAAALSPPAWVDRGVLEPFRYQAGGTLLAGRLALRYGIGVNLGGGFHFAKPDSGGGFNVYADIPVAIRALQAAGAIRRALVVDLDAHHGNGTALCLDAAHDDSVFTFDLFQADLPPVRKEPNDLDVPLPAGLDDEAYLAVLATHLPRAFEAARADLVFYLAGADVLAGDAYGGLKLTPAGLARRDRMVVDEAVRRGVGVVVTIGAGYSRGAWPAQADSIRGLIERYGLAPAPAGPSVPAASGPASAPARARP